MKNLFYSLPLLLLCSCAGKYNSKLDFSASESIRVAVLPFVQVNEKDEVIDPEKDYLIDDVSVVSYKLTETPAVYLQKLVQNELQNTGLDILSPALVEANLTHHDFDDMTKVPPVNADKVRKADPKDLCTRVFSCDAVLYGKITRWSRSYYGIQSVNSVGIDVKLVSAKDGKVLFSSSAEDSDSRGITKGPTGFSNLLIEPIQGLDNKIITNLAQNVVKKMLSSLKMDNRPEFLQSSAPAIYASAHDFPSGRMSAKDSLTVLLFGSASDAASFSIGNVIENIPMVEKDKGHYIGKYFPLPSDSFSNQNIYVALTDNFGRTTKQKIGTASITLQ
jgi:hypothetical protein